MRVTDVSVPFELDGADFAAFTSDENVEPPDDVLLECFPYVTSGVSGITDDPSAKRTVLATTLFSSGSQLPVAFVTPSCIRPCPAIPST